MFSKLNRIWIIAGVALATLTFTAQPHHAVTLLVDARKKASGDAETIKRIDALLTPIKPAKPATKPGK